MLQIKQISFVPFLPIGKNKNFHTNIFLQIFPQCIVSQFLLMLFMTQIKLNCLAFKRITQKLTFSGPAIIFHSQRMFSKDSFLPTRIVPRVSLNTRGLLPEALSKTQAEGNEADNKERTKKTFTFFTARDLFLVLSLNVYKRQFNRFIIAL